MIQVIQNYSQLVTESDHLKGPFVIGFFGDFSQGAKETLPAFKAFCEKHPRWPAYLVDVGRVRDVHGRFQVAQVPAVILVENGVVKKRVVGSATTGAYEAAFVPGEAPGAARPTPGAAPSAASEKAARPARSVTVFTTQSCPWCVRVKNYLRQNQVNFKEVDVGRDPQAGRELVRRTGQTGVPQLDINGSYVVGFDKAKIDRLLGLSGAASAMN